MSIKVQNLDFSYDRKRQVLNDISFTIDDGKMVCLIGPNGVGKSTLFKAILRLIHCYSGSKETAKEAVKLGLYLGFGGTLTYKNARRAVETAEILPLEHMLLETDCPYLAPVPHRGKRNDSRLIAHVAERAAEIRGCDPQEIIDICRENAMRLFQIGEQP